MKCFLSAYRFYESTFKRSKRKVVWACWPWCHQCFWNAKTLASVCGHHAVQGDEATCTVRCSVLPYRWDNQEAHLPSTAAAKVIKMSPVDIKVYSVHSYCNGSNQHEKVIDLWVAWKSCINKWCLKSTYIPLLQHIRISWPLTLIFDLLTWKFKGISTGTHEELHIYLPSLKVVDCDVKQQISLIHN